MSKCIDLNKVIIPFIYSIYTISIGMLLSKHHGKSTYFIIAVIILYLFLNNIMQHISKHISFGYHILGISLIFLVVFAPHGRMKDFIAILLYVASVVLMIISMYKLYSYNILLKQVYKYYGKHINFDTFKPNFIIPFILLLSFIVVIYPVILSKIISHNIIISLLILYGCTFIVGTVFYALLYQYKYFFDVVYCSNNKVYIDDISIDSDYKMQGWLNTDIDNIETYDDLLNTTQNKSMEKQTENNQPLHNAISTMDGFIKELSDDENIKEIISNIQNVLIKIDNYHNGEEYKFNKYILNINEKYMPYIEKLISSYINNKELPNDITKEMQEKIIDNLKEIDEVLEKILLQMYNMNMLELESYMDAFDVILSQNGFKDNKKGDK